MEIPGPSLDALRATFDSFEDAAVVALDATMTAALAGGTLSGSVARISLDDLNAIPALWAPHATELSAQLTEVYVLAANYQGLLYGRAVPPAQRPATLTADAAADTADPEDISAGLTPSVVRQRLHEDHLPVLTSQDQASLAFYDAAIARMRLLGDDLLVNAQVALREGMLAGESVPKLTARVREATGATAPDARRTARTWTTAAANSGSLAYMRQLGLVSAKRWLTRIDGRERPTHEHAMGQTVPIDAKFIVGGSPMDHPGDMSAPSSETANCRCTMLYVLAEDEENEMTAAALDESALVAAMSPETSVAWDGVICVEGIATGERPWRKFAAGSLIARDFPLPLRWNIEDSHGGMPQTVAVLVGRIDGIERRGDEIYAWGLIDTGSTHGAEVARLMGTREDPGFLRGVSIDADDPQGEDVTLVFPANCPDSLSMEDIETMPIEELDRCMTPEGVVFNSGRISAATLCDIPAFAQAQVYLSALPQMGEIPTAVLAAAYTVTIPEVPPAEWFTEPADLPPFGAIEITEQGRIYGYLAPGGTAHRGYAKRVTAPKGNVDYARWMNRPTVVMQPDGSTARIATGAITMACGHAPVHPSIGPAQALSHYDDSCSLFATAVVGENARGVWIAGAVLHGTTPEQLARAMALQLSGDWRPHQERRGWRELTGALLVPVPGFAMAQRATTRYEHGELVASAVPVRGPQIEAEGCGCWEDEPGPLVSTAAQRIAASIGRDTVTLSAQRRAAAQAIAARVRS